MWHFIRSSIPYPAGKALHRRQSHMRNTSQLSKHGTEKLNAIIQRNKRRIAQPANSSYQQVQLFPLLPHPGMRAAVIVPVKNEAHHLCNTLDALRNQSDTTGKPLSHFFYEVLLLANNCTDATFAVAKAYQLQHPSFQLHVAEIQLPKHTAHIGTVRRLLMDEAFRRHMLNGHDGIILSTDGDTEVDECWIANTMYEIENGYDAVGGRILTRRVSCDSRRYFLQDTAYRYLSARLEAMCDPADSDPWPRHFQCFGASMAVRCSAYQKAGRLPVIPFLEDEAFSRALYRIDARIRKSPAVKVYTSSRLTGRVPVGLSAHLAHLAAMKQNCVVQYVESPTALMAKGNLKKQLRDCWRLRKNKQSCERCVGNIASQIGVSLRWLLAEMDIAVYFGELWEKTEQKLYAGGWHKKHPQVNISEAIRELRHCFRD